MWRKGNPWTLFFGSVNWCSLYGKQYGGSSKKLKIELLYEQQFHSWVYIQKKIKTVFWKDICTPMFLVALFTTAKICKKANCPSTDEWIKKMWYIYIYIYIYMQLNITQPFKKNEILPLAVMWMDPENVMLSERSQTEEDKYCMYDITHMWNLKVIQW